jgi:hypothetical protein
MSRLRTVPDRTRARAGTTAHCERCGTALRKARLHPLEHSLALTVAALILLVMCATTLMTVGTSGIVHAAGSLRPLEIAAAGIEPSPSCGVRYGCRATGVLIGTIYVLPHPRSRSSTTSSAHFVWVERLTTCRWSRSLCWASSLPTQSFGDLVKIELNAGVYALLALIVGIVWADGRLGSGGDWDAFDSGRARNVSTMALATGGFRPGDWM